ncbi:hypothetical protein ACE6H2_020740 [Prunus campanulata]
MERNSVACVMEWSIELEKALRSKKSFLGRTSSSPMPSFFVLPMPSNLETSTQGSVLSRLFYLSTGRGTKRVQRVLCKTRVHMQAELLRRVKVVFDNEDVEDRALGLGLFGCWAHFAKQSASIRYLVLSSLVSSHVLEVQVALFAAGCFTCIYSEGSRNPDKNSGISLDNYAMKHELRTIECAKRMLAKKNNWLAYRVGVYAACQGDWLITTFIFKQLVLKVRSNSCSCWVKSLLLLLPKQGLETHKLHLTPSSNDLGCQDASRNIKEHIYSKELAAAYNGLCSSLETLKVGDVKIDHTFFFQHRFLSLRVKVIKAVVDDNTTNTRKVENLMVGCLISLQKITQISLQLKRLAREFDLVTTSFIYMDKKSSKIISELAMSCSLLAFCTGFDLYIPSLIKLISNSGMGILRDLDAMLVQNLVGRLGNTNHETSKNLCLLLEAGRNPMDCFHMQSRTQACKIGSKARDILSVCNYAVSGIVGLKSKANRVHNEEGLSQLPKDGLKLLYDILMKWMQIPFCTPMYFFKFSYTITLFILTRKSFSMPNGHLALASNKRNQFLNCC